MPTPILTVDVEEWFHVCGDPRYARPEAWEALPSRVAPCVEKVLGLLDGTGSSATFFVLGWVARRHPDVVRSIAAAGHEVASHGDLHRRIYETPLAAFREDVRRSRGTLEELTGKPVTAYRAPEWSMRSASDPGLAVLVEEGFTLDSSLVAAPPIGDLSNPLRPTVLATASGPILEVPPLQGSFFFRPALLGGGVCSRLSRAGRIERLIQQELAAGGSPVLYLHPWELDDDHPPMHLSLLGRLVHFGGRQRTGPRLAALLRTYRLAPISSVLADRKAAA